MPYLPEFLNVRHSVALLVLLGAASAIAPAVAQDGYQPYASTRTARSAPQNTTVIHPDYIMGPGDGIGITVYDYEEFTANKVILSDGTVILPLIGAVPAAGRSPDQFARELEAQLREYLVNPVATVTLTTLRPVTVNVAGEVQRPGPVRLRSLTTATGNNNAQETPTVTSALIQAGGITRYADIQQVVLRRAGSNNANAPLTVNLWNSIGSDTASPDLVLQDGDSIFIPRLADDATLDRRLIARSSLAPVTVRVRVVGEVVNPGEVDVPPNSSISSAVAIAGGPTVDARMSRVQFVRLNDQGVVEQQEIDLRNLTDTYQIQEGDVVMVPKKGSAVFLDGASRVLSPLGSFLRIFGL